ncbi:TetR/AcrR family transcriptional regulator [Dactylosporangium sp. AC04546]|uniref:TetR/AcrR family transcriptional regulator n=1 Tax=Dactylosporangium sp. AC04546 TaxID=2862460 RepID=UPI001EDFA4C4|nr:TetR/AcrR family transcriptional regulator [Dactylosporangium sp. AC04546]WVK87675.1 TetR/AcrR family transcriptional regulator [Dactylosporangium sp. AC04546]
MASPRERLLSTAAELFYSEGIGAVGVEKLCQTAGVSKRTMYQLFDTKSDLVAEALRTHGPRTVEGYFPPDDAGLTPRERILHVFERLEDDAGRPGFHGCPFVNTSVELHDPSHRASTVALHFKRLLESYFERLAQQLDAPDPEVLAAQLTAVFDGCSVRAVMRAAPLDGLAVRTAAALLDAAITSEVIDTMPTAR